MVVRQHRTMAGQGAKSGWTLLYVPVVVWLAFAATVGVFVLFPGFDLTFSALFHAPGEGFPMMGSWYERLLYNSVPLLMYGVSLGLIGFFVWQRRAGRPRGRFTARELAYLLLVLALAPGLIVNSLFKEHWGRARPVQVVELGGARAFSPALMPSDQQGRSFSSGHAAAAFWLVTVALVVARRGALWAAVAAVYAVLVGLARIGAGEHFLSDVVISFFIVFVASLILHRVLFGHSLLQRERHCRL